MDGCNSVLNRVPEIQMLTRNEHGIHGPVGHMA